MERKKVILSSILILIIAGLVSWFIFSYYTQQNKVSYYRMAGHVSALSEKTITVTGQFTGEKTILSDGSEVPARVIEFTITPQTIFTKKTLVIPKKYQISSGVSGSFIPFKLIASGSLEDLIVSAPILDAQSTKDLSRNKKVNALRIEYQVLKYDDK